MKPNKSYLIIIPIVFAILFSYLLGFWNGKDSVFCRVCAPEDVNFSLFWEAWNIIEERHINSEDIDIQEMIYGAISGMVKSLEDPYTVFFDPGETKRFLEDVGGSFEGVGMEVGIRKGGLQVIAPLEGTPAQKAGLRPGDKIVKIDDVPSMDITIEEAVTLIRGPKGSYVVLTILRDGWDTAKEFKIKRAVIKVPSLKWELLASTGEAGGKDNNIAYIKLYHFSEHADVDFQRMGFEILKTPARKIILDLRSNPGGYLEVSRMIAGWFLKRDQIVVIEDFGGKREQKIHKANGNSKFFDFPIVVLINEGTASASEILASALRDNRGVKLIGKGSYGKGSVQELERLSDKSSLKITIGDWLTANGEHLTDVGLEPDIEIEITDEDYDQERDPQLDKAIEIIKNLF